MSILNEIVAEARQNLERVSPLQFDLFVERLCSRRRVFVAGAGRTGLIAAAFATRLAQLGWTVFAVGEPTTPAVRAGDLLLACTGSGETPAVCRQIETAQSLGAEALCVTGNAESRAAKLAASVLEIPAAPSKQLGRSSFEQALLLVLDGLASTAAQKAGIDPSAVWSNHANL
ncbi:MAG: SIS domain-containing protein [Candidatus Poribacteria bacterium]|nr:SIS domain-containing protein [Candidatus Poribacteria bacterium]